MGGSLETHFAARVEDMGHLPGEPWHSLKTSGVFGCEGTNTLIPWSSTTARCGKGWWTLSPPLPAPHRARVI